MSANVVVLIDKHYTNTERVHQELSTNWTKEVAFTVLELCPHWTSVLFSDDFLVPNTMYLICPSRSHGKARLMFALHRALWKRPVVVLCFCDTVQSEEFKVLFDQIHSLKLNVKLLTNNNEPASFKAYDATRT